MLHSPRILSGPEFECLVPLRDLVDCVVFRGGVDLAHGFDEIGDGPLVLTPDHKYFYFYFPDWPAGTTTTSNVSVARAPANSVLEAALDRRIPTRLRSRRSIKATGTYGQESEERRLPRLADPRSIRHRAPGTRHRVRLATTYPLQQLKSFIVLLLCPAICQQSASAAFPGHGNSGFSHCQQFAPVW